MSSDLQHLFRFEKILLMAIFAIVLGVHSNAQNTIASPNKGNDDRNDEIKISLLTPTSGDELYTTFGHSAIRVVDRLNGTEEIFDFGVFDFSTPNFYWKFFKGKLNYKLTKRGFNSFLRSYKSDGRGVKEERINLPVEDKRKIHELLLTNYLPENRNYQYDFFYDNCSTRIRDLIYKTGREFSIKHDTNVVTNDSVSNAEQTSFRQHLKKYMTEKKWVSLGIDLLLGMEADKMMTFQQEMFLPDYLSANLGKLWYGNKGVITKLMDAPVEIIAPKDRQNKLGAIFTPFVVFGLVFLLFALLVFKQFRMIKPIRGLLYIVLGILGSFLFFMWVGTEHTATNWNLNLLWMNPLYLLVPLIWSSKWKKRLLIFCSILAIGTLLFWPFLPQYLNLGLIPLIATIILLNMSKIFEGKQTTTQIQS